MHPKILSHPFYAKFFYILVTLIPLIIYFCYELGSSLFPFQQTWVWPLIIHSFGVTLFYGAASAEAKRKIFRFNFEGLYPTLFLSGCLLGSPLFFAGLETFLFENTGVYSNRNYLQIADYSLLYFVILIPFIEEIFFRGCLSHLFIQYFGDGLGRLYSVLCFVALHDSHFFALGPFLLAIICEWLQRRYKNLTNCFILHGCANFSAILFMHYTPYFFEKLKSMQIFI